MNNCVSSQNSLIEQSISLSKELVATAGALEMAPSKIASDFASAASSIVVYGNRGIEVFKGLEAASKASGVEISNLISIASKMDTFQGAAEVAGRLNSILGGGLLNSSQLLMASEEERIRLVIESVQSQGVQFNDLDKYTQKAIANAAGITDMAEANKFAAGNWKKARKPENLLKWVEKFHHWRRQ